MDHLLQLHTILRVVDDDVYKQYVEKKYVRNDLRSWDASNVTGEGKAIPITGLWGTEGCDCL